MRKRKIAVIIIVIIIGLITAVTIDLKIKYNVGLLDYIEYNSALTPDEEALVKEKPLNFGIYEEPPLAFTNEFNNYNAGIVSDYISQLAIETKSNVNIKIRSKASILEALESSEIDFVVLERTPQNFQSADLTMPLFVVKTKIVVPVGSSINHLRDLEGSSLVTLISDNESGRIEGLFDADANIDIIEVENMYQCIALIRNESVSGFIGDDMKAAHYLSVTSKGNVYRFLDSVLDEKHMSLAVPKGNPELLSALNKGILSLKKKNLIAQTQYKWLGDFITDSIDLRVIDLVNKVIVGIILLTGALTGWNYVITKRVNEKTRELLENKEELRMIIDAMKNGIMVIENNATIIECNTSLEKIVGISRDKLIGKPHNDIEELQPFVDVSNINKVINIGQAYYLTGQNIITNNKKMLVIEDYSEKYINEKKARHESKMIAVGRLSAGLAHEIRNPLGLIKSYNFLIGKYALDEVRSHAVKVIDDSVDNINRLIENLLRFSKLSNNEVTYVNARKVISQIIEEERNSIRDNIKIASSFTNIPDDDIPINGEVLRMVVQNLIRNGLDSFQRLSKDNKKISVDVKVRNNKLNLRISDNGAGIDKEIIDNIFDPFYSTKENGTGLGLYIVNTEVENNNGTITVSSVKEKGTLFDVTLPILR
ncbi:MAG: transporter substrate-binding domain-containing protein [Anaerovoracaceae bacterium]